MGKDESEREKIESKNLFERDFGRKGDDGKRRIEENKRDGKEGREEKKELASEQKPKWIINLNPSQLPV